MQAVDVSLSVILVLVLLTVAAIDMLTSKARHRLIGLEGKS